MIEKRVSGTRSVFDVERINKQIKAIKRRPMRRRQLLLIREFRELLPNPRTIRLYFNKDRRKASRMVVRLTGKAGISILVKRRTIHTT